MHIVHVGTRYEPETLYGPTRAFSAYAKHLVELGHDVTIVQFSPGGRLTRMYVDGSFPNVILTERGSALRLGPSTTSFFRDNLLKADVYHVHSSFAAHCLAAHLVPVPYVVSTHGAYTPSDMNRRRLRNVAFRRFLGRRYLSEAAAVHAITPAEKQANIDYAGPINVQVVPNAIQLDVTFSQEARLAMRSRLVVADDEMLLLYMGRLDVIGKGLDLLLEGFDQAQRAGSRPMRLVLAGPPWMGNLKDLIGNHIAGRVTILPPVLGEEKRALLSAADAFATLSRWDVMPTAVLDALGTGLPILVTEATGFGEFVRQAGSGAVVSNSQDVAKAISRLELTTLVNGRSKRIEAALATFHPRRIAEAFAGIYETSLQRKAFGAGTLTGP